MGRFCQSGRTSESAGRLPSAWSAERQAAASGQCQDAEDQTARRENLLPDRASSAGPVLPGRDRCDAYVFHNATSESV
jgi:hypothetical protein